MRDAYVKTLVEIQDDVRVLIGNLEKTLEETKTALFTQNLDKARMVRDGDDKFDEEIRSIIDGTGTPVSGGFRLAEPDGDLPGAQRTGADRGPLLRHGSVHCPDPGTEPGGEAA